MNRGRGDFICAGFARAQPPSPHPAAWQPAESSQSPSSRQGSSGIKADQGSAIELAPKYGFDWVEPFGPQLPEEGGARYVDVPIAAWMRGSMAAGELIPKNRFAKPGEDVKCSRKQNCNESATSVLSALSDSALETSPTARMHWEGGARYVDVIAAGLRWAAARHCRPPRGSLDLFGSGLEKLPAEAEALKDAGAARGGTAIPSRPTWTARCASRAWPGPGGALSALRRGGF